MVIFFHIVTLVGQRIRQFLCGLLRLVICGRKVLPPENTIALPPIPLEQFAKRGLQASHRVLASSLFCDIACALHKTSAIKSVDLANCHDAIAHPIVSIALQSFKVRKVIVAMMFYVLETMQWLLKTAFGQSKVSFGGTQWNPLLGLGQGNGVVPPGFLAVSTLVINVYHQLGHGTEFVGPWLRDIFMLAVVLYDDDLDLLQMAKGFPTDDKFLALVQSTTNAWVGLVHATGRSLKPQKCFWYMIGWRWIKEMTQMRKLYTLPYRPLTIPQPNEPWVAITPIHVSNLEENLGVYTCPSGNFTYHVSQCQTILILHLWGQVM